MDSEKKIEPTELEAHTRFMKLALEEAEIALTKDEVPVGAILVSNQQIIARAHNLCELLSDVTAHAEMQIITMGANYLGGKYLEDCQLYVTLEPCCMCAGALYWSRIGTLIYGASDEKRGYKSLSKKLLHPKTKIYSGILAEDCGKIIQDFFKTKRG